MRRGLFLLLLALGIFAVVAMLALAGAHEFAGVVVSIGGLVFVFALAFILIRDAVAAGVRKANPPAPPATKPTVARPLNDPIPESWGRNLDDEIERNMRR